MTSLLAPARPADAPPVPAAAPAAGQPLLYRRLLAGDPFPWLVQAAGAKARFAFDTLAGRYQLFCFFLDSAEPGSRAALEAAARSRALFDDRHCSFVGVSLTPRDREGGGLRNLEPGVRFAWDFDHRMSRACGVVPVDSVPGAPTAGRRAWVLVDPSLHVIQIFPFDAQGAQAALEAVARLPEPDRFGGVARPAPILLLPNVFDPGLCGALMRSYDAAGGEESGVHRDGLGVIDPGFKRRKDHMITEPALLEAVNGCISRRVAPEIEKLFFMRAGFIERHVVGCYAAADGGHFAPHRDNRQGLTAHRRFAVSINLNADFAGGEVVFPEYGMQGYKAPPGWAVVFPCAALHQVRPVTSGARYAFLPFVYDEAGRAIREAELARLAALDAPRPPEALQVQA